MFFFPFFRKNCEGRTEAIHGMRDFVMPAHSLWIRLTINFGTSGPRRWDFRGWEPFCIDIVYP